MTHPLRDELEKIHEAAFRWALACSHGDEEMAREILQTAYVRVISGRAEFSGRSTLKTWFFGVIRLISFEEFRRTRRHQLRVVPTESVTLLEGSDSPEDSSHNRGVADRVHDALSELSDQQRNVLELVFYHDLSIREASDVLDMKLGTARTHYKRGKEKLGTLLADLAEAFG